LEASYLIAWGCHATGQGLTPQSWSGVVIADEQRRHQLAWPCPGAEYHGLQKTESARRLRAGEATTGIAIFDTVHDTCYTGLIMVHFEPCLA